MNKEEYMKNIYGLFVLVFFADLVLIATSREEWRVVTKTLLMPFLAFAYWQESKNSQKVTFYWLFFLGLIFSFLGDVFLLFDWGFLAGLISFFIAHVLYSVTFFRQKKILPSPLIGLPILGYAVLLVCYLYPSLAEMKIPVMAYAAILAIMLYACFSTQKKQLIVGGLFFVLSDSLLSLYLFVNQSVYIALGVMITYVLAQFFLLKGMLSSD